jgi:hypothetical protein
MRWRVWRRRRKRRRSAWRNKLKTIVRQVLPRRKNLVKSFVTLGKPIVHDGTNIIIRDTMLLAPGNSKSLDAIVKLYPSIKQKLKLSKQEVESTGQPPSALE